MLTKYNRLLWDKRYIGLNLQALKRQGLVWVILTWERTIRTKLYKYFIMLQYYIAYNNNNGLWPEYYYVEQIYKGWSKRNVTDAIKLCIMRLFHVTSTCFIRRLNYIK